MTKQIQEEKFLLVTDLDGTFLVDEYHVHPKSQQLIRKLNEKYPDTFFLAFASGREPDSMLAIWNNELGFLKPQFHICMNGGIVLKINHNQKQVLQGYSLQLDETLINFLMKQTNLLATYYEKNHFINQFIDARISNLLLHKKVYKIYGFLKYNDKWIEKIIKLEQRKIMTTYIYGKSYIEITSGKTNKYLAAQKLADFLGVKKQNIIAIGNGINDLPLMQNVKNSFLVANHFLMADIPQHTIVLQKTNRENFLEEIIAKLRLL